MLSYRKRPQGPDVAIERSFDPGKAADMQRTCIASGLLLLAALPTAHAMDAAETARVEALIATVGAATSSPEAVIVRSKARVAAYQQIDTQYATQIQQVRTLSNEINTLQQGLDTNKDGQLSEAEVNAGKAAVTQIQQKEQQINTAARPITIAQAYVLDQLAREVIEAAAMLEQARKLGVYRALVQALNEFTYGLTPAEFRHHMTVEQMAGADTTLFVARDAGGATLGMGALRRHGGVGEVKRMFVKPSARGLGVGGAMISASAAAALALAAVEQAVRHESPPTPRPPPGGR